MDDGIELNFAPAAGGVRKPVVAKAGRWTARAKAKQDVRKVMKKAEAVRPAAAAVVSPPAAAAKSSAPAPAASDPSGSKTVRPSSSQSAPLAGPSNAPRLHNGEVNGKGKERAAGVGPAAKPPRSAAPFDRRHPDSPISRPHASAPNPPGPSSRPSAPSKSKGAQVISSLFSFNPSTTSSSQPALTPSAPGLPSNAPLASDTSTFAGLGLDPLLIRHLKGKMTLGKPTGIQQSALPYMLSSPLSIDAAGVANEDEEEDYETITAGPSTLPTTIPRDVFIQSQTGSGKTLTYLLPIIQTLLPLSRLSYIDRSIGTLAIILAPTRELAQQISKVLDQLLSLSLAPTDDNNEAEERPMTRWLVSGLLTGGATKNHEKNRLRKGIPILVATPGRLLDHLQNTASFNAAKTMFLVLDEADRLMDLGFEETIQGIIKALDGRRRIEMSNEGGGGDDTAGLMKWPYWNRGRQTVLCSATVDAKVERLAGMALRDPIVFRPEPASAATVSEIVDGKKRPVDPMVAAALQEANAVVLPQATDEKFTPPSQLSQKYIVVPTKLRLVSLVALLRSLVSSKIKDNNQGTKIIVFLSSTDAVDFHWKLLGGVKMGEDDAAVVDEEGMESADEDGDGASRKRKPKSNADPLEGQISLSSPLFPSTTVHRLHGSLPLRTRMSSLSSFSSPSPSPSILLATSVASRGLDLPLVRAVVQYDLPTEGGANEYVHRVGRTARAGKGGEAWAFVGPSEEPWIAWVEGKMGAAEGKGVRLGRDTVEDVLRRGFGGKSWEYEARATEVQMAFERWILADEQNTALARKAFGSFVRAYSTHPLEEKKFFHPKSLHLGHLAKSFALRETPGSLSSKAPSSTSKFVPGNDKKRKRPNHVNGDEEEKVRGKESTARNETEKRMYDAVRKAGRAVRSGGKMGEFRGNTGGTGGGEFQVVGASELERMVAGR